LELQILNLYKEQIFLPRHRADKGFYIKKKLTEIIVLKHFEAYYQMMERRILSRGARENCFDC
jgi:hypothetical protein